MRVHQRAAVAIATLIAAAVMIPAQTAEAASAQRVRPHGSSATVERQAETQSWTDSIDGLTDDPGDSSRRPRSYRIHRTKNYDWWVTWYGTTKYVGVRFTWTATWKIKRRIERHGTGALGVVCGFVSPYCTAMLWFDGWWLHYMVDRAIARRQCFGYVYRVGGWPAPPIILRNFRCDR